MLVRWKEGRNYHSFKDVAARKQMEVTHTEGERRCNLSLSKQEELCKEEEMSMSYRVPKLNHNLSK